MRWAILGTGSVAQRFALGLRAVPGASLAAVGSRAFSSADAFGTAHGIARRHASYAALAADPEVDVVYIATPNAFHAAHATMMLRAGKAVLIEKPIATNAADAEAIAAIARQEKRFAMEAMWTRFMPAVRRALEWIAAGEVGHLRLVEASFGFRAEDHELPALLSTELGTGSLLDVGVYVVALAIAAFDRPPIRVACMKERAANGVDRQAVMSFAFEGGGLAHGACAVTHETPYDAWLIGTRGSIHLHAPFWCSTKATLVRAGREDVTFDEPHRANGFEHEALAVTAAVREGRLEHPELPLARSLDVMRVLDALRAD